jgi:hypothetical protein
MSMDAELRAFIGAAIACVSLPAMAALVIGMAKLCVSLAESTSDREPRPQPRQRVVPFSGRCRVCDYDLAGITGRCPECGTPFSGMSRVVQPALFGARPTREKVRRHAAAWLATCLLSVVLAALLLWDVSARGSRAGVKEFFFIMGLPWLAIIAAWASWIQRHWDDNA